MLEALAALDIADPTAAVRKAVLLYLAHEGRMTVARAGQLLGLDREDSIRWYTSHGDP